MFYRTRFFYKKHVYKNLHLHFSFQSSLFYAVFNNTTAQNINSTTHNHNPSPLKSLQLYGSYPVYFGLKIKTFEN